MLSIKSKVSSTLSSIAECAQQAGLNSADVQLIAVSKTRGIDDIQQAIDAGCRQFGESYVQEALTKIQAIQQEDLIWHFIGPIQSNKTQAIARHFGWVHSIDREKIAKRLNDQRPPDMPALNVCIQVNISEEPGKSGVNITEIEDLAKYISQLPRLRMRGLMAIPQAIVTSDETAQRRPFARLRQSMQRLNEQAYELDTLSMGMSNDYCAAIKEGATLVRIGSGIFGKRK